MIEATLLQVLHFAAYAILVSALMGALRGFRGRRCSVSAGLLNFIPMAAAAVSALINRGAKKKQEGDVLRAEEADRRAQWDTDEEERRQAWEERYGSPAAESSRMNATLRLGRLLGHFGGREGSPVSLVESLDSMRARPEYEARTYRPGNTKAPSAGGWGFAQDLVNAAGYYQPNRKPSMAARAIAAGAEKPKLKLPGLVTDNPFD